MRVGTGRADWKRVPTYRLSEGHLVVNRGNDPEFLGKSARIPTLLEEYGEGYPSTPTHLVRLRHFDTECWSLAFYTCRDERSEPCAYPHDSWFGTVEQAFDVGPFYQAG